MSSEGNKDLGATLLMADCGIPKVLKTYSKLYISCLTDLANTFKKEVFVLAA